MGVFSEMSIEQERGDSPTPANIPLLRSRKRLPGMNRQ